MKTKSLTRIGNRLTGVRNLRAFVPWREISLCLFFFTAGLQAQTTLNGDHVITGDLNVLGINYGLSVSGNINVEGILSIPAGQISCPSGYPLSIGSDLVSSGWGSVAIGTSVTASGDAAIASGVGTYAAGLAATSFGWYCSANGDYSVAMGAYSAAGGQSSVSMGSSIAVGNFSVSMGESTIAEASHSLVIGRFNDLEGDSQFWWENDPVFVVGNGTGSSNDPPEIEFRNAFAIYKNGNVKMTGKIEMPRQGDILMGEFGNPE